MEYEELLEIDRPILQQALDLIRSTDTWKDVEEDPDWNLHMAEHHLSEALKGEKWK